MSIALRCQKPDQHQAAKNTDKPEKTNLTVFQANELNKHPAPTVGMDERKYALQHKHQRQS